MVLESLPNGWFSRAMQRTHDAFLPSFQSNVPRALISLLRTKTARRKDCGSSGITGMKNYASIKFNAQIIFGCLFVSTYILNDVESCKTLV